MSLARLEAADMPVCVNRRYIEHVTIVPIVVSKPVIGTARRFQLEVLMHSGATFWERFDTLDEAIASMERLTGEITV